MKSVKLRKLLTAGLLCVGSVAVFAEDLSHADLRDELLKMATSDQEVRHLANKGNFTRWSAVDTANQARLKQIVAQFGWPTFSMVGKDGANAAWLLAQHADTDKPFQLNVLELMEPLVLRNEASGKNFAYLYDRTHYPQRFGTQGDCVSRTEWQPFQIEDIAAVDERRQAVDLPPLSEYAKFFKDACSNPYTALHSATDPKQTVAIPKAGTNVAP
jgi:hypothetical protein